MMDLSERVSASTVGVLAEKQNERDLTKGKLDNLKGLSKHEIGDKTEHNQRVAGFQSNLDDLDKVIELKQEEIALLEKKLEDAKALKPSARAPPVIPPTATP